MRRIEGRVLREVWFLECECGNILSTNPWATLATCGLCSKRWHLAAVHHDIVRKVFVKAGGDANCDSRCINATGPDCDCSCGGANHGRGNL